MKATSLLALFVLFSGSLLALLFFEQNSLTGDEQTTYEDILPASVLESGTVNLQPEASSDRADAEVAVNWQTRPAKSSDAGSITPAPYKEGVVALGVGASLGGKLPFPEESPWNQRIDDESVDPMSKTIISSIGIGKNLHPDFGSGTWDGAPIGIPYVVVTGDQPKVPIVYTAYGDESDPGPYPIPPGAPIEGHPNQEGDRHVIVIDRDNWKLYEIFRAFEIGNGELWRADSGAIFDLAQHPSRPVGWTSADAAGLPIFPGLVRYEEVAEQKEIRHALRFTVNDTRRAFVAPATHWASNSTDPRLPPLGMRVRLKADYDISGFPPHAQVILTALKRYGMILADNGSDWFISGSPDPRWDNDALQTLKKVKGKDLEVVMMGQIVTKVP